MSTAVVPTETLQGDFGAYLMREPTLVAAVGIDEVNGQPAIYPGTGEQDSKADPYIVWRFENYSELQLVGGPPDVADITAHFECYAGNYETAKGVGAVIQNFLRFLPLPIRLPDPSGIPGAFILLAHWIIAARDDENQEGGLFETVVEVGLQVQFELVA